MLLKCPECELQISDKATFCPHCGYPIQPDIKPRKPRNKNNKRKRLPKRLWTDKSNQKSKP